MANAKAQSRPAARKSKPHKPAQSQYDAPLAPAEMFEHSPNVKSETFFPQAIYRRVAFDDWVSEMPPARITTDELATVPGLVIVDTAKQTIMRDRKIASFRGADVQWRFILALVEAGDGGIKCAELLRKVWPGRVVNPNNLAQQSSFVGRKLRTLRLAIKGDNSGLWRLVPSGIKPA